MSVKLTYIGSRMPTDYDVLGSLYGGVMAQPPQLAEPMGNSIRRLLNATLGGRPGWRRLPMESFSAPEPEQALPQPATVYGQPSHSFARDANQQNSPGIGGLSPLSRLPPSQR